MSINDKAWFCFYKHMSYFETKSIAKILLSIMYSVRF